MQGYAYREVLVSALVSEVLMLEELKHVQTRGVAQKCRVLWPAPVPKIAQKGDEVCVLQVAVGGEVIEIRATCEALYEFELEFEARLALPCCEKIIIDMSCHVAIVRVLDIVVHEMNPVPMTPVRVGVGVGVGVGVTAIVSSLR